MRAPRDTASRSSALPMPRQRCVAIDGENAQRFAARHRDAGEIAEDADVRLAAHSRAETLFLGHFGKVVRRIVRFAQTAR